MSPPVGNKNGFRHGLSRHPLYGSWYRMMHRCYNPSDEQYADYGGRGITVCPEWHDPTAYVAYIERELGPRPPGHTLDRIDNDGPYGPGKVRWAPRSVQNSNQRRRPQRGYPVGASGYRGVHLHRQSGRYQAKIYDRGRAQSLGYYATPEEAARAYDAASLRLSGDRGFLNFPGEAR
jgi:hypothetical protein